MKITKKMRKKANGMNAATMRDYKAGYQKPGFSIITGMVSRGTTYVNELNFK